MKPIFEKIAGEIAEQSLKDLTRYIVEVHHSDLRSELPSLGRTTAKLENFHDASHPEIAPLRRALSRLTDELYAHMKKEETILFPAIRRMEQALEEKNGLPAARFGSIRNPIWMMEQEHNGIISILREIRALTRDYTLSDPECEMYRVLSHALQALETDIFDHIELENNVLFPKAMLLEEALLNGARDSARQRALPSAGLVQ
jgi:regulator of cell morphogenesis and NO signaling